VKRWIVLFVLLSALVPSVSAEGEEISDLMHGLAGLYGSGLGLPDELTEFINGVSDIKGNVGSNQCKRDAVALAHNLILEKYTSQPTYQGIKNWVEAFDSPLDKLKGGFKKVDDLVNAESAEDILNNELTKDIIDEFADYLEEELKKADDEFESYSASYGLGGGELFDCNAKMDISWLKSKGKINAVITGDCKCIYRNLKKFRVEIIRDVQIKYPKESQKFVLGDYYLEAKTSRIDVDADCSCSTPAAKPGFLDRLGTAWDRLWGGDDTDAGDETNESNDNLSIFMPLPKPKNSTVKGPTLWDQLSWWDKIRLFFSFASRNINTGIVETEEPVQEGTTVGMRLDIVEDKLLVEVPNPNLLRGNFMIELDNMPANEIITVNISERPAGITTNNDGKGEALICVDDEAGDCILHLPKSEDLDIHINIIFLDDDYKLTVPTADDKPMVFIDTDTYKIPVKFLGSEWVITDLKSANTAPTPTTTTPPKWEPTATGESIFKGLDGVIYWITKSGEMFLQTPSGQKYRYTILPPLPPTTPTPACTWTCGSWGACSSSGTQIRTCTSSPSPCTGTNPNPTSQACTPEPTCDTGALGSCLSGNCIGVYGPGGSANCPEQCKINDVYDDNCMTNQCNVPYQNCIAACHTSNPPCTLNEVYALLETISS